MGNYECKTVWYRTAPHFLDYKFLSNLFLAGLHKGEAVANFIAQCKALNHERTLAEPVNRNLLMLSLQPGRLHLNSSLKQSKREQLQDDFDVKDAKTNALFCWLLAWCGCFKAQEKQERKFLLL